MLPLHDQRNSFIFYQMQYPRKKKKQEETPSVNKLLHGVYRS